MALDIAATVVAQPDRRALAARPIAFAVGMGVRRSVGAALAVTCLVVLAAAPAFADFPYSRPGSDTTDYAELYLDAGSAPADLSENELRPGR